MNQILQENINQNKWSYNRRYKIYQLQFIISFVIAVIFLFFLFWKLYQNQQQEKMAKELLTNYQLTALSSTSQEYETDKTTAETHFIIGMLKIEKINLAYSILFETSDELLKLSLCRFAGPMPNEVGNLCIAGHNYVDNRFFSKLSEVEIGDLIEVYDISGQKQEYHIFQKYEVDANDLSCITQDVGNNKIVTLLTCNNSNSNRRLIVQAK